MSKIKKWWVRQVRQYGAEKQQFGTAGVEGVVYICNILDVYKMWWYFAGGPYFFKIFSVRIWALFANIPFCVPLLVPGNLGDCHVASWIRAWLRVSLENAVIWRHIAAMQSQFGFKFLLTYFVVAIKYGSFFVFKVKNIRLKTFEISYFRHDDVSSLPQHYSDVSMTDIICDQQWIICVMAVRNLIGKTVITDTWSELLEECTKRCNNTTEHHHELIIIYEVLNTVSGYSCLLGCDCELFITKIYVFVSYSFECESLS